VKQAQKLILELLSDKRPHPIEELLTIKLSTEYIDKALTDLTNEQAIINDDGLCFIP
jgi:hypothetical protein